MSKFPTKAAGNVFCDARCEAAKFNDRFKSREGTAECVGIDRTRLARIELNTLDPYPDEVVMMSEAYNAPELENHYCASLCPIGRRIAPKAERKHFDRLTIDALNALGGLEGKAKELLKIAADGKVSPEEVAQMESVREAFERAAKVAAELQIFMKKYVKDGQGQ